MKKIHLTLVAALFSLSAMADNTVTTVEQVTDGVQLTDDVDYTITSTTPFGTAGSVDIVNTDHAVLIFKYVKPSVVISDYLGNIFINGEAAESGTNCQVKMYASGAIVMPYGDSFTPLTCYTEEGFAGDSCNSYTTGHSGGYMKTLTTSTLINNIRSFKLKRGYMVTFATGTSGWGYSRCFIADKADLEFSSVPAPLNGKISSYRIFKWNDAQKKGLASNTSLSDNNQLGTSWCYSWGMGWDMSPDVECVVNHIYEDWPSSSSCGSQNYSSHMKTNNEPGNSSDDTPQTVDVVLANWQNLMRTGMRLCSESSHDGSMSHLKAFIDSIDARGWRCDVLDLHCYWASGFSNLTWYSSYYGNGRPIWISEWLWGASWNTNGIFSVASGNTGDFYSYQTQNYNRVKEICEALNDNDLVERYAYWNSEANCSKLLLNGELSEAGEYYAAMESGLAYNADNEFIPKIVYTAPSEMELTYTKKSGQVLLEWTDPNGDMIDSIVVQHKLPNTTRWVKADNVTVKDKTSSSDNSYTYTDTITDEGIHYFRVLEYYNSGKYFTTNEGSFTVAAASSVGALQYGRLRLGSDEAVETDIEEQEVAPYVIMGMVSNKNSSNGITNQVQSMSKAKFKFRLYPWQLETPVEIDNTESVDYLILPPDTVMHLSDDMMLISQKAGNVKGEEVEITFPEAFPEGVTPVVVAQQNTSISSYAPVTVRAYDITNTGFKVILTRQAGVTTSFNNQNVNYFACTPGQISIGGGKLLSVGRDDETLVGGSTRRTITFTNAGDTLYLSDPYIIAAAQTMNYDLACIFRQHSTTTDDDGNTYQASIRRQVDGTGTSSLTNTANSSGDYIGWMIISDDPNGDDDADPVITTAITGVSQSNLSVTVSDGSIYANGSGLRAYNASGVEVGFGKKLPAGIYFVTDGQKTSKIVVK